jgi:hypothetical protein
MAPSMSMARSGAFLGRTSASMETSKSAGASGKDPSTAWLPMMITSSSWQMSVAALMTCSSCALKSILLLFLITPKAWLGGLRVPAGFPVELTTRPQPLQEHKALYVARNIK